MRANRIIKFRAWDGHKMIDDFLQVTENGRFIAHVSEGEDFTPMQFTGLLDKNGKEIYEGDIVKLDYNAEILKGTEFSSKEDISYHKVIWDNERAMFWDYRLDDGDSGAAYADGDISFLTDGLVIGNIYTTPNLLTPQTR